MATHSGLSYSRSFVSSLVVIPILVAMVMMVLSNNLVTAFGMMAVFAIVRFRNILRDTLDTTYILTVLVVGMACGTQRFPIAVTGALLACAVMLYLWYTGFGARHRYDVIVNLHWSREGAEIPDLVGMLDRHSLRTMCASQRSHESSTSQSVFTDFLGIIIVSFGPINAVVDLKNRIGSSGILAFVSLACFA
jgi:hypothetical protein